MKILQFGKYYPPVFGGIESVMFDLTEGLNDIGHQCDVLCSNNVNEYVDEYYNNKYILRKSVDQSRGGKHLTYSLPFLHCFFYLKYFLFLQFLWVIKSLRIY